MNPPVLHALRFRARRIATVAVALFALNWLGLALAPCAMAYGLPGAEVSAAAQEHCPHCPPAPAPSDEPPCHSPPAPQAAAANDCGAIAKPAVDARDAKVATPPLLIALSGPTLALAPVPVQQRSGYAAADPLPPPEAAPPDRYCRRLE